MDTVQVGLAGAGIGLFELSSDSGMVLDESFLTVLGYSRTAVGSDAATWYLSLVHPDDLAQATDDQRRMLAGGGQCCVRELRLRRVDGRYVRVRFVASPADGRVVASIQLSTERRDLAPAALDESTELQAVIDNMPFGLVSFRIDPADESELVLTRVNSAARKLAPFDWSIGRRARELFPGAEPEDLAKRMAVALGGPPFEESKRQYVDGTIRGAFDTVFFNSGPGEVTGILHDVTERVRLEDDLRRSNENLEQFAYGLAHDLQEPVRMVRVFTELLERELTDIPPAAVPYLRFMREGAARMKSLIQELLAYARLGHASSDEPVAAGVVLAQVVDDLALAIAEAGAQVVVGDLPTVRCAEVELRQVFLNLVGNALKFRGASPPTVEIRASRRSPREWEFCVQDNGIGIGSEDVEEAFRLFGRLHDRNRYAGNGIGLAVCKRIVEQNGGSIWIRSTPGRGTAVHFTLSAG